MGPPPFNTRHTLRRSLFHDANPASPLLVCGLRLHFAAPDGGSRIVFAHQLLLSAGLQEPEELRMRLSPPPGRWLCHELPATSPLQPGGADASAPSEVALPLVEALTEAVPTTPLYCALLLGLCGPTYYAPDRPLIWSEARLARTLMLYSPSEYLLRS